MNDEFDPVSLFEYLAARKVVVDRALEASLPPVTQRPAILHEAMWYSVMTGGKRLRSILCMATAEMLGHASPSGFAEMVLPTACALEFIHCSSLVCDDLPALDNDTVRRGRPTCHVQFGEATAILAEHALFALAFEMVSRQATTHPAAQVNAVLRVVAQASGSAGMVGGEMEDLRYEGKALDLATVEFVHRGKTGALIRASAVAGAILGGATPQQIDLVDQFADALGLAFQIVDDILGEVGDPQKMGKPVGADRSRGKPTYTRLVGVDASRREAERMIGEAMAAIEGFGPRAEPLRWLARYALMRES